MKLRFLLITFLIFQSLLIYAIPHLDRKANLDCQVILIFDSSVPRIDELLSYFLLLNFLLPIFVGFGSLTYYFARRNQSGNQDFDFVINALLSLIVAASAVWIFALWMVTSFFCYPMRMPMF